MESLKAKTVEIVTVYDRVLTCDKCGKELYIQKDAEKPCLTKREIDQNDSMYKKFKEEAKKYTVSIGYYEGPQGCTYFWPHAKFQTKHVVLCNACKEELFKFLRD